MIKSIFLLIKNNYLLLIILSIGIFFRLYNWPTYGFNFDQVQILSNAENILKGKLTLIGPRTGPANSFTGPLIYYLTVPVLFLFGNIKSVIVLPLLIGFITALTLYFLAKHYINKKSALITIAIWSISPILIKLDRTFWNPNLSLLAFSLIAWPIFFSKKISKVDLYLIALGSFLSYQAHFSAFLLIPVILLFTLIYKLPKKIFLVSCLGIFISLLPTIIFDFRHDFINFNGIMSLFFNQTSNMSSSILFKNISTNIKFTTDVFSRLLFFGKNSSIRHIIGLAMLLLIFFNKFKSNKLLFFKILLWLILVIFFMSLYHGQVSEYYFIISLPFLMIFLTLTFNKINKHVLTFSFVLLFTSSLIFTRNFIAKEKKELTLENYLAIKEQVIEITKKNQIKNVLYLFPHGTDYGIKYLIEPLINKNDTGMIIKIIYPTGSEDTYLTEHGRIGIQTEVD